MPKETSNKPVLPGEHHPFKTKLFGVLLLVFLAAKIIIAFALPERSIRASDLTTANITSSINQQRGLRNLVQLNTNPLLTEAAQYKSDDMQARHYFAHLTQTAIIFGIKLSAWATPLTCNLAKT